MLNCETQNDIYVIQSAKQFTVWLSIIKLEVVIFCAVIMSVFLLNCIIFSVVLLNVVKLNVFIMSVIMLVLSYERRYVESRFAYCHGFYSFGFKLPSA
jgi:hypothetical protein